MNDLFDKFDSIFALAGRLLLALIFIFAGFMKMADGGASTMAYMEASGVPTVLFWPAALFEALGGLMILVGYQTRLMAFLFAGFCIVTAVLFHAAPDDQIQMTLFMKNISMAGGFLLLVRFGAGELSLDNRAASADT